MEIEIHAHMVRRNQGGKVVVKSTGSVIPREPHLKSQT